MKKKKKKVQLPFRLNILFFVIFLLFSVLILQLGIVQILNGEAYEDEINRTIQDTTSIPVPRGKMYDRNHNAIVDNKPLYSITYTPEKNVQAEDRLKLAKKLSKYISMYNDDNKEEKIKSITERNKKEYWYLHNREEADSRLSEKEESDLDNADQYKTILDRITEEEYEDLTEEDFNIILIKKELDKAYSLTPQIVKNEDVTPEEYARVAEHLSELPGINATTDWNRDYPYGDTFNNLLGNITSQEQGIPAEKEAYYLTRGYSRNDRVGISGLEQEYEEVLRGRKEQIEHSTDKDGNVIGSRTVVEGQRGKDLVLTVDIELQEKIDDIVREELNTAIRKHPYANRYLKEAMAVVMNPQTGEILAVSGQYYNRDKKKFEDAAYKALHEAHIPGSTVKGASVLAGYQSGVISPGNTFYDSPIKIAGTPRKSSWRQLGSVNDIDALRMSSNIYMFYIALKMGGEHRYPFPNGSSVNFDKGAFQEMRNYFNQFGLGVKTGVDFPYEATGVVGSTSAARAGNLLDLAIGQYDTYTTLQLAQYTSTIANGGYRVRPHFLKEIRMPNTSQDERLGPVYRSKNTDILNRVQMPQSQVERVQEGFRQVYQSQTGTAYSFFSGTDYKPAGKTGTAESVYVDDGTVIETENRSLIGYAPHDEPEVAFALIVPYMGKVSPQHPINHNIGKGILDTYFELKKERDQGDSESEEEEE